jgi:hypothetical protein
MFGKENFAFLKQILSLKNGIPSHDTINYVFRVLIRVNYSSVAFPNGRKTLKKKTFWSA